MVTKTHGTVSAERQREMSGLEFVQGLASGALPLNTIAQTLGYDIVEAGIGPSSSPVRRRRLTSIPGALCMAVSRRCFSIAAWGWRFNRLSKRASGARRSSSRFRWSARSLQRSDSSGPKAMCSTPAVASAPQRDAPWIARDGFSRTARQPASSFRIDAAWLPADRPFGSTREADLTLRIAIGRNGP